MKLAHIITIQNANMSTDSLEITVAELIDEPAAPLIAFRDDRWKTRWIIVGLACFSLLHVASWIDRQALLAIPPWLLFAVSLFLPQAFFLIFPLVTREKNPRAKIRFPTPLECLIELGIAIPIVIGIIVTLLIVGFILERYAPGTTLAPDALKRLASSGDTTKVYLFALMAFTVPPLCEEVFFRGFIFNAFRARTPWLWAALAESLIFGFGHTFGVVHAIFASTLGLVLTLVYRWRGTLLTSMFIHAGVNFIAALGILAIMALSANSPRIGFVPEPNAKACTIGEIIPDSAAEKAGLQPGDVIEAFDGKKIPDFMHLVETLWRHKAGDKVRLSVRRAGETIDVEVVLQPHEH